MKTSKLAVAAAAVAAALALTGCSPSERAVGNPDAPVHPNPTGPQLPAAEAAAGHNAADIAFVQGMIPHHEQAIALAALVPGKGASEEVTRLAEAITQAQEPEIAQLQSLQAAWSAPAGGEPTAGHEAAPTAPTAPAPTAGHEAAPTTAPHAEPAAPTTAPATPAPAPHAAGTVTPAQLQQLQQARGAAFDKLFLQLMIAHHEGAVQMAQAEVAGGLDPEATALAQQILTTQQAEITEMRTLLAG